MRSFISIFLAFGILEGSRGFSPFTLRGYGAMGTKGAHMKGTATVIMCTQGPVALTREAGKNIKLAELLQKDGVPSVEVMILQGNEYCGGGREGGTFGPPGVPCIAHADGEDLPKLPLALIEEDLVYVVVTSPEAAKVFLGGWRVAGKPSVSVACVGKATGEALRKGGVEPAFTPSKATGETLAAELPMPDSSESGVLPRILYPASVKAQQTLEKGLQERGFEVHRLNTYDTIPALWGEEEKAAAASVTVAAFGSPSAVKTWAARVGTKSTSAACIGETSASACRAAGWVEEQVFFPDKPGMEGWAQAVRDALEVVAGASGASSAPVVEAR